MARGLYKGEWEEIKALLFRDSDARRAYVIGEGLYKFINFSIKNIPSDVTYQIVGKLKPIDRYRFVYYLYPRKESDNPMYILCYKKEDFKKEGFYRLATLDDGQFILKKKKED